MAKGRKPAIGGLARPEGFLDDIVRPVIQKAADKVAKKTLSASSYRQLKHWDKTSSMGKALRRGAARQDGSFGVKAFDLAESTRMKRVQSYSDAARKANKQGKYPKMETKVKKAVAANNTNASVRRAAKAQRAKNRIDKKIGYR
jgi:hypothetical protein